MSQGLLPTPEHSQTFNDYHNALRSLMLSKDHTHTHTHTHTHSLLASGCRRKKGWSSFVIFCLPFRLLLLAGSKQHSFQLFPDRGHTCDTAAWLNDDCIAQDNAQSSVHAITSKRQRTTTAILLAAVPGNTQVTCGGTHCWAFPETSILA